MSEFIAHKLNLGINTVSKANIQDWESNTVILTDSVSIIEGLHGKKPLLISDF